MILSREIINREEKAAKPRSMIISCEIINREEKSAMPRRKTAMPRSKIISQDNKPRDI
jgi:hypothetical protein